MPTRNRRLCELMFKTLRGAIYRVGQKKRGQIIFAITLSTAIRFD